MTTHPIRRIRKAFRKEPALRCFSTQRGFAELIGWSESYIRNLETGIVKKLSKKLADDISEKTGVSSKWLLGPNALDANIPILSSDDQPWRPMVTVQRVKTEIAANHQTVAEISMTSEVELPEIFGEMVRNAVRRDLDTGSHEFMTHLANLLRSYGHLQCPDPSQI